MFSIAMSRLIEIHKIHVNLGIRNITVELGMQVQQWFLKSSQAFYPHF